MPHPVSHLIRCPQAYGRGGWPGASVQFRLTRIALVLLASLAIGCGGTASSEKLYPVQGKVTCQGKPVVRGVVIFSSTNPDSGTFTGQIQQDGSYSLASIQSNDGAPAGEYVVAVRAFEDTGPATELSTVQPRALVPTQYVSLETTPVRKTVQESKLNQIDIDLQ